MSIDLYVNSSICFSIAGYTLLFLLLHYVCFVLLEFIWRLIIDRELCRSQGTTEVEHIFGTLKAFVTSDHGCISIICLMLLCDIPTPLFRHCSATTTTTVSPVDPDVTGSANKYLMRFILEELPVDNAGSLLWHCEPWILAELAHHYLPICRAYLSWLADKVTWILNSCAQQPGSVLDAKLLDELLRNIHTAVRRSSRLRMAISMMLREVSFSPFIQSPFLAQPTVAFLQELARVAQQV